MAMFKFPTDLSYIKEASQKILDFLSDLKLEKSTLFDVRLCFEEALINAMKYGNKLDKSLNVDVDIHKREDHIEIVVQDQGKGFDFKNCPDPTKEENIEKTKGRGVFLIQRLMDQVIFEKNGSCLRMIKKIK